MLYKVIEIIKYADLNWHSLQRENLHQSIDIPFCYNFSNLEDNYLINHLDSWEFILKGFKFGYLWMQEANVRPAIAKGVTVTKVESGTVLRTWNQAGCQFSVDLF